MSEFEFLKTLTPQFISFEGTEGVGKTTAITNFCRFLDKQGIEYVKTREPGGSEIAEVLREILLNPISELSVDSEILLIFTARADHLDKIIRPALKSGKWVICDRFIDSTVAYQGFGRRNGDELALRKIDSLTHLFVPRLPDVSFWLDLDVKTGIERAGKRGEPDRIEKEALEFFERVYQGFVYQHDRYAERLHRIDASGDEMQVLDRICQKLLQ